MGRACILLVIGLLALAAAEETALARARSALAADDPAAALTALGAEDAAEGPLAATLRGHALAALERDQEAESAYRRALAADPRQQAAGEGLIRVLLRQERWADLRVVAARWALEPDASPALLLVACDAARQAEDRSAALQLADLGSLRFPDDLRFRRRQAAALAAVGRHQEATVVWRWCLSQVADDAALWLAAAGSLQAAGDAAGARQALAVAHALDPADPATTRALLQSLILAEQGAAALPLAVALVGDRTTLEPDDARLVVAAAMLADDPSQARAWLGAVSPAERDADWQRRSLQLALRSDDRQSALAAVDALIASGAADVPIRLWAARLAEEGGDLVAAEAHLQVAVATAEGAWLHRARLALARCCLLQERRQEAVRLLEAALHLRPTDPVAAQLLAVARG